MRTSEIASRTTLAVTRAGQHIADMLTPTLRLGVTGLSGAGKTVFITALVRCLTENNPTPIFSRLAGLSGFAAYLEPQPDDDVPRFDYERHLDVLTARDAQWPQGTERISQLRLTLEWSEETLARALLGLPSRLHIDIIDYPGEWLTDLALLNLTFDEWSRDILTTLQEPDLKRVAEPFLKFLETTKTLPLAQLDEGEPAEGEITPEQCAIDGARSYSSFLTAARETIAHRPTLGPGRFLLPGDLEGSPQLTFYPLPPEHEPPSAAPSPLRALLARRFESYKTNIVKPFFENHFSKLDRQIVLVDVLSALNGGGAALSNLEHGLDGVLRAFRPGKNTWLSRILTRRIDRILFAATKADHLHCANHRTLQDILAKAVSRASARTNASGAETSFVALAALRATQDVAKHDNAEHYQCLRGVPLKGEVIGGRTYDGQTPAVIFPGDLPDDPLDAFDAGQAPADNYRFVRFKPPVTHSSSTQTSPVWSHIGLDRVVDFLIGDKLP